MSMLIFKALADETRLRLAHILFHYELSVNELTRVLSMGQSRVSRHLKILTEAGILRWRRDGLWIFYSTPAKGLARDFLRAVLPFMPDNEQTRSDLALAAQILEERSLRARQFFNANAENWDDLNHEVLGDFDLAARVCAALPENCGVAVDLGCGTGEVMAAIMGASRLTIGVDGSARMLELCRGRLGEGLMNGRVSLRIGELNHLPLANQEADFACVNLVMHHLPRPEDIFPEIQRILKPGGKLFISDFTRHADEEMRQRYGDHWLGFDMEDMAATIKSSGFALLAADSRPVNRGLRLFFITAQKNAAQS